MTPTYALNRGFALTRHFATSRAAVYRAWTDPAQLGWFFNPGIPSDLPPEVDLRPGGVWRQEMIIDAEKRFMTGGLYAQIVPDEKLSFYWGAEAGWPPLDPKNPQDNPLCTLTLKDHGAGTTMEFQLQFPDHLTNDATEIWLQGGIEPGWIGTIKRLEDAFAP